MGVSALFVYDGRPGKNGFVFISKEKIEFTEKG